MVNDADSRTEPHRLLHVVGRIDDGEAVPVQPLQQLKDRVSRLRVDAHRRFIAEEQLRPVEEGGCEIKPALHPPGKGLHQAAAPVGKLDSREQFFYRDEPCLQGRGRTLRRPPGSPGRSDAGTARGSGARAPVRGGRTPRRPVVRRSEPLRFRGRQGPSQDGREAVDLPAPLRPDQPGAVAGGEVERYSIERGDGSEAFDDRMETDERSGRLHSFFGGTGGGGREINARRARADSCCRGGAQGKAASPCAKSGRPGRADRPPGIARPARRTSGANSGCCAGAASCWVTRADRRSTTSGRCSSRRGQCVMAAAFSKWASQFAGIQHASAAVSFGLPAGPRMATSWGRDWRPFRRDT